MIFALPAILAFSLILGFYAWRSMQKPQLHRKWEKHHAQLPHTLRNDDGTYTIHNIRHCRYRAEFDFDLDYVSEVYDPKTIINVWYTLCPWGPFGFQAHAWLTCDFADGRSLVIAAEVRKTNAFTFYAYKALVGNFELFYVVSDELDVLALRTHIWKNETRMYPLSLTQNHMTNLFNAAMQRINSLSTKAEWYRITHRQCNTEPMHLLRAAGVKIPWWHPKYIIAGWCDQVLFSYGIIQGANTFIELKERYTLDLGKIREVPLNHDFSKNLRIIIINN